MKGVGGVKMEELDTNGILRGHGRSIQTVKVHAMFVAFVVGLEYPVSFKILSHDIPSRLFRHNSIVIEVNNDFY